MDSPNHFDDIVKELEDPNRRHMVHAWLCAFSYGYRDRPHIVIQQDAEAKHQDVLRFLETYEERRRLQNSVPGIMM